MSHRETPPASGPETSGVAPFKILELLPEIREIIYALTRPQEVVVGGCQIPEVPVVAAVNRLLRQEALASYFTKSHFVFRITDPLAHDYECYQWLNAQEDFAINCIRTFAFSSALRSSSEPDLITVDMRSSSAVVQIASPGDHLTLEKHQEAAGKIRDVLQHIRLDKEGVRRLCKADLMCMMQLTVGTVDVFDENARDRLRTSKLRGLRMY